MDTTLDALYFRSDFAEFLKSLAEFDPLYTLAGKKHYSEVISDISDNSPLINRTLYEEYSESLRRGVGQVFGTSDTPNDANWPMRKLLEANVARFGAFKSYAATQALLKAKAASSGDEFVKKAQGILNTHNRYLTAEYNTTVARARTAKQWSQFSDQDHARLFPNIRWLPSRSASPREEHRVFWGKVWPKDDPFWSFNQPGNLYNCKCDWEETSDPADDERPTNVIVQDGLEDNPGTSGNVFSDKHPYIKNCNKKNKTNVICVLKTFVRNETLADRGLFNALISTTTQCDIDGIAHDVKFIRIGLNEYAQSMKSSDDFVLKNLLMPDLPEYIKNGVYVGRAKCDINHNTGKTLRIKRKTDYFYYFKISLPNGNIAYLNIGRFKANGYMYLYTITSKIDSSKLE